MAVDTAQIDDLSYELTREQIAQSQEYASSAYNSAVAYLSQLSTILGDLTLPSTDISIPNIEIPDLDIEIPPDLEDIDFELDIPAMPSLESFNEDEIAGLLNNFENRIGIILTTGGTGIDEDVENAIYDRARDRQAQTFEDEQEKIEGMYSSRGFSFPPGSMTSLLGRLSIEKLRSDETISNEILINQTKLAQGQMQFAMTGILELFKTRIDLFGKKIVGFTAQVEGYKARVLSSVQLIEVKVRAFEAKTKKYIAEVEMNKVYFETLATKTKMQIEKGRLETEVALKQMEATIAGYLAMKEMQLGAVETGGTTMSQLAASALSAISTATGFNFHGNYSSSDSFSHGWNRNDNDSTSQSYSEVHSYDETGI